MVHLCGDDLPEDFAIGVIYGRSGSGKTQALMAVRAILAQESPKRKTVSACIPEANPKTATDTPENPKTATDATEAQPEKAVCSLFRDDNGEFDGLSRLGSVGLNKIPSWLRPFRALSTGERSRASLALALKSDADVDDFAATVDDVTACSMSHSLQRTIRANNTRRVLIATTKSCAVRFLQPDFVLFAATGRVVVGPTKNGAVECQKLTMHISMPGMERFIVDTDNCKRWEGTRDPCDDLLSNQCVPDDRTVPTIAPLDYPMLEGKLLQLSVECDDATEKVSRAFEYSFDGTSKETVWVPSAGHDVFSVKGWPQKQRRKRAANRQLVLGAIVGPSGSGKSTALQSEEFVQRDEVVDNTRVEWREEETLASHFDVESIALLESVFLLPPACISRSVSTLSSGERHRADIARLILDPVSQTRSAPSTTGSVTSRSVRDPWITVLIDEFTSFLDRTLARCFCTQLEAYLRSASYTKSQVRRLVVAGVHSDILQWLQPDWALHSKTGVVSIPKPKVERLPVVDEKEVLFCPVPLEEPNIEEEDPWLSSPPCANDISSSADLTLSESRVLRPLPEFHLRLCALHNTVAREIWEKHFSQHHYFSKSIPSNGHSFLLRRDNGTDGEPVAFIQSAIMPGGHNGGITHRESRLVVLPSYQGFGIGPRLSELVAQKYLDNGMRYFAHTAHPRLGGYRMARQDLWRPTFGNLETRPNNSMGYAKGKKNKKKRKNSRVEPLSTHSRTIYRHQFLGTQGDGNDSLRAKDGSACQPASPSAATTDFCWEFSKEERFRIKRAAVLPLRNRRGLDAVKATLRVLRPSVGNTAIENKAEQLCSELELELEKFLVFDDAVEWEKKQVASTMTTLPTPSASSMKSVDGPSEGERKRQRDQNGEDEPKRRKQDCVGEFTATQVERRYIELDSDSESAPVVPAKRRLSTHVTPSQVFNLEDDMSDTSDRENEDEDASPPQQEPAFLLPTQFSTTSTSPGALARASPRQTSTSPMRSQLCPRQTSTSPMRSQLLPRQTSTSPVRSQLCPRQTSTSPVRSRTSMSPVRAASPMRSRASMSPTRSTSPVRSRTSTSPVRSTSPMRSRTSTTPVHSQILPEAQLPKSTEFVRQKSVRITPCEADSPTNKNTQGKILPMVVSSMQAAIPAEIAKIQSPVKLRDGSPYKDEQYQFEQADRNVIHNAHAMPSPSQGLRAGVRVIDLDLSPSSSR